MGFEEALKKQDLKIFEERTVSDDTGELVFFTDQKSEWESLVGELLGPAVKPEGQKPSRDDLQTTNEFGGIRADQTLFKKGFDGYSMIAMFWPWQDGQHTTLKWYKI